MSQARMQGGGGLGHHRQTKSSTGRVHGSASAVGRLRRRRLVFVLIGAALAVGVTLAGLGDIDRSSVATAAAVGLLVVVVAPVATRWVRNRRLPVGLGLIGATIAIAGDRVVDTDATTLATPVVLWAAAVLVVGAVQWRMFAVHGDAPTSSATGPAAIAIGTAAFGGVALAVDGLESVALTVLHAAPLASVLYIVGDLLVARRYRVGPILVGVVVGVVATSLAATSGHRPDLELAVAVAAAAAAVLIVAAVGVDGPAMPLVAAIAVAAAARATAGFVVITLCGAALVAIVVVYGLEPSLRVVAGSSGARRRAHRDGHDDVAVGPVPIDLDAEIDWTVLDADVEHATAEVDWSIVDGDLGAVVDGLAAQPVAAGNRDDPGHRAADRAADEHDDGHDDRPDVDEHVEHDDGHDDRPDGEHDVDGRRVDERDEVHDDEHDDVRGVDERGGHDDGHDDEPDVDRRGVDERDEVHDDRPDDEHDVDGHRVDERDEHDERAAAGTAGEHEMPVAAIADDVEAPEWVAELVDSDQGRDVTSEIARAVRSSPVMRLDAILAANRPHIDHDAEFDVDVWHHLGVGEDQVSTLLDGDTFDEFVQSRRRDPRPPNRSGS